MAMMISHSSLEKIAYLARPTSLLWPVGRLAARKMEVITGPVLLQMLLGQSPKRCGTSPKQVLPAAAIFFWGTVFKPALKILVISLHWSVDSGFSVG